MQYVWHASLQHSSFLTIFNAHPDSFLQKPLNIQYETIHVLNLDFLYWTNLALCTWYPGYNIGCLYTFWQKLRLWDHSLGFLIFLLKTPIFQNQIQHTFCLSNFKYISKFGCAVCVNIIASPFKQTYKYFQHNQSIIFLTPLIHATKQSSYGGVYI